MFWQSYKNTLKNLARSPLFWGTLAGAALIVWFLAYQGQVASDRKPDFVLSYAKYIQWYWNGCFRLMSFLAIPLCAVISTALVLERSFGDDFFEVERAGGVKPASYLFGRLAALVSVNLLFAGFTSFFSVHYYYLTRGGLQTLSVGAYLADSTVRTVRLIVWCELTGILLLIGLTYLIGSLAGSGFAGMIGGTGYALLGFFGNAFHQSSLSFFTPIYRDAYAYFIYADPTLRQDINLLQGDRIPKSGTITLWLAVMLGLAAICLIVSVLLTRKREI